MIPAPAQYLLRFDDLCPTIRRNRWEQYRKLECDAIRVAFAEGSMAPVAQMECWIDLTDDHRKFVAQEYGYMRNGGPPPSRPPR